MPRPTRTPRRSATRSAAPRTTPRVSRPTYIAAEAARIIGVTRASVSMWILSGTLRIASTRDRHVHLYRDDVLERMRQHWGPIRSRLATRIALKEAKIARWQEGGSRWPAAEVRSWVEAARGEIATLTGRIEAIDRRLRDPEAVAKEEREAEAA